MRLVQINNSAETFTATSSGAIATHIWEVCRHARHMDPLVITQSAPGPLLSGIDVSQVPPWKHRRRGWRDLPRRVLRRMIGWREDEQRTHAGHVIRTIRERRLMRCTFLLHNDPEMAVRVKTEFPSARVIHHFHNPIKVHPRFVRRFRTCVDRVSAVSRYVALEVQRLYGAIPVEVIYNGVDAELFKPRHRPPSERVVLNFLGRTGIEKGPDLLLRAGALLASEGLPVKVNLVGSNHWGRWELDPYQAELSDHGERLIAAGGRLEKTGHLSRAEVPGKIAEADVHVLPSRWDEPCALSLLEGMATGLAVVASSTGGTPEILGDSGMLFQRDNVLELAERLKMLITDVARRRHYALLARKRAEAFTWAACWNGFFRLVG